MAVLVTRKVSLPWSICLLLIWINISLMPVCSQGTFILRKQKENEIIFVGETITMECRAPSNVSNPQFRLLDSQSNVLVDPDFNSYADGHYGYPYNVRGANFEITIHFLNQSKYLCEISGDVGVLSTSEINLNVFPRTSPQCFLNTSASVTIGEVIGFSCYQEVVLVQISDFRWRQILRDGTVNEHLPSQYSFVINQFKRKLSTRIIATLIDEGSEFECVLLDSGSEKTCTTGEISIQQNQEVELTISPNPVYSLDRGGSQTFSCESSDPSYNVLWVRNTGYQNTDANVDFFGSVVSVSIPTDTTIMNGVVLTFECAATFGESTKSEILLVSINFESNLNPLPTTTTTTTTTTQPTQVMLTFTPATVPPLDRGAMVEIECSPSLGNYEVLWIRPVNVSERDAEIDNRGGTLHIHIPIDTTLMSGDVLTFVCLASFNGVVLNRPLTLNVVFTSTTIPEPTNATPTTIASTTAMTSTQPTRVMLKFTPATVPPLGRGDIVEVECTPSLENYKVSWITVGSFNADAQTELGSSTLRIRIPVNTTLMSEAVLNFACVVSFNGAVVSRQLTVKVLFESPTNLMSNAPTVNINDMSANETDNTFPGILPVVIICSIIFACFIVLIANVLFFRKRVMSLHCKETGMKSAESDHEATNDVFNCKNIYHTYHQTFQTEGQVSEMSAINSKGSLSEPSSSFLYCRNTLEGHGHLYARNIPQEYGGERRHVEMTGDAKHQYYECKPAITGKLERDGNYMVVGL
ncbi:hypothetical protein HOLleu_41101 [Holothuria leucospilota]|uniref:Ig-like domain-containing protein n=1 Tax=Holothuria leucospilota TaxID=206669 RepID=A0A9Q0YBF4_HOLLE|nr:hypothetical protein HOLleu_41101 [Holothuria leucospilota]